MKLEKTFRRNIFTALFIATVALANDVNALVDLGGGMIYDSDQDITWLQDSNYTLHHSLGGRNGQMTWAQANSWAKTFAFNGNSGWRLPHGPTANTSGPLTVNATGGELYNLYYQLGNTQTSGWKNKGPFSMIWPGSFWTDLNAGWTTSHHYIFDGSLSSNYLIAGFEHRACMAGTGWEGGSTQPVSFSVLFRQWEGQCDKQSRRDLSKRRSDSEISGGLSRCAHCRRGSATKGASNGQVARR